MYDKLDIEKVNQADIRDFVPELQGSGNSRYRACPECGNAGKNGGLRVTHKRVDGKVLNVAKCFHCDFTLKGPIDAVKYFRHLSFPEAVKAVADASGLHIESIEERERRYRQQGAAQMPFYVQQLYASGLTEKDVAVVSTDEETGLRVAHSPFRSGTMAKNGAIVKGDDMLIYYYDLYGRPEHFVRPNGTEADYVRVRWSNPEEHKNVEGKPIRYQTPKGAKCMLYIPQHIRNLYAGGEEIDTLFVTEGEKKAEKACKHGLHAVGIQGIFNIGNEESGLVSALAVTIQACRVKHVVLLLDSDWNDLSDNLGTGCRIDGRPNLFSKAVIKFRDYLKTLHAKGTSVEVYFGYVKDNERGDKGIDDLLVGTLRGREVELAKDVDRTMHTHNGQGDFVNIHKITAVSDFQIRDYWSLTNHEDFFKRHRDALKDLSSFRIGGVSYTVEDGRLTPAFKCSSDKEIWVETFKDNGRREISFDFYEALGFLTANGYLCVYDEFGGAGDCIFVQIADGFVRRTAESEIRRFVFEYVCKATKDKEVIAMFISRLGKWLGKEVLERLRVSDEDYDRFEKYKQCFYFLNGQVTVTQRQIDFGNVVEPVWEDRQMNRRFRRVEIFRFIEKNGEGNFLLELTPEGRSCEFLRFLTNTCNFWHKKERELSPEELSEMNRHLANKLSCIGFLLNDYKFLTERKAVVAVDGRMSDVGQSNGRSGKSIVGVAVGKMMAQVYIDGRNTSNDDQFMFGKVTPRTRNIFFDDAQKNFNFEKLFGVITGDFSVNPKGKDRIIISASKSPKFYITTNHAFPTRSSSTRDRIIFMIFSDWYNEHHAPVDDFGHQLFDDWDDEQWNLFDNLMVECNFLYLRSMSKEWVQRGRGAIPAPMERIELRNARQTMGEDFLSWAETYFDPTTNHLNARIERKLMQEDYQGNVPGIFHPNVFRTKLVAFCRFKAYHFNVYARNRDGQDFSEFLFHNPSELFEGYMDKSGGREFFCVAQHPWAVQQTFMN